MIRASFASATAAGAAALVLALVLALAPALPAAAQAGKDSYYQVSVRARKILDSSNADIAASEKLQACAGQDTLIRQQADLLLADHDDLMHIGDELMAISHNANDPMMVWIASATSTTLNARSKMNALLERHCPAPLAPAPVPYHGPGALPPPTTMTLDTDKPSYGGPAPGAKKTTLPGTPAPKGVACPRGMVRTYVGTEYRCVPA